MLRKFQPMPSHDIAANRINPLRIIAATLSETTFTERKITDSITSISPAIGRNTCVTSRRTSGTTAGLSKSHPASQMPPPLSA